MTGVDIPVARPELLPPEGDTAGLDQVARTLFATASRYDDFADLAHGARRVPRWWGEGYESYARAARRAAAEHDTLAGTVRRVARTCAACSDTLGDLIRDHQELAHRRRAHDRQRADLVDDVAAAGGAGEVEELRERARTLEAHYRTLVLDHRALEARVRANEELLRRAFAGATSLDQILSPEGTVDPLARQAMRRDGAPGPGVTGARVRAWWSGLTDAERESVVADFPRVIGGTDGLPARARDQANRVVLDDYLAELEQQERDGTLTPFGARELADARAARRALATADTAVDPLTHEPAGGFLWLFDPGAFAGDGRVAIGVGDPDTAADVSVLVPGVGSDGADAAALTGSAVTTYLSARANGDGSSVATMAWLGYDAPDTLVDPMLLTGARADDGGDGLSSALAGLRASRPSDHAHLTVIGHSYGSTTAGQAMADHHPDVDDLVLLGSPGVGVDHASQLGLDDGHVWVGTSSHDIVADLHGPLGLGDPLGPDPAGADFGGSRFQAEDSPGHVLALPGGLGLTVDLPEDHRHYFDPDTESAFNLGHLVDGSTSEVNLADPRHHAALGLLTIDPEGRRHPTSDVPGQSDTGRPPPP